MLLKELYDTTYEDKGFRKIRKTVRALVRDGDGNIGFMHVKCVDDFGVRDHYESVGGGVELGEHLEAALHREVEEELGVQVSIERYLGMVINRYNTIETITMHHYYVCDIIAKTKSSWTDEEKSFFEGEVWLPIEKWSEIFAEKRQGVNGLIHEREAFILEHYRNLLEMEAS